MPAWLRASAPVQGGAAWLAGGWNDAGEELLLRIVTFCRPD